MHLHAASVWCDGAGALLSFELFVLELLLFVFWWRGIVFLEIIAVGHFILRAGSLCGCRRSNVSEILQI
jgi:hypothetical protein